MPIEGVLVTDAELDHTVGLLLLRESGTLPLYATDAVARILDTDSRITATTRAFSTVPTTPLVIDQPVPLTTRDGSATGLTVEAFTVVADPPRFAPGAGHGHTVGFFIRDTNTGSACAFVPGCGDIDTALLSRLGDAALVLFDGTFWNDDELIALGIGQRTARQMDHLPIGGADGSLSRLATLPSTHRVYTHINNTNPVLLEQSPQRAEVTRAGLTVGADGMRFEV